MKLDPPPAHPNPTPQESEEHHQYILRNVDLTDIDCENLEGDYQIALILTKPELSPLMIENWYNGFQGLIAVSRISFAVSGNDEDADHNGKVDHDCNGDGYHDNGGNNNGS